MELEKTAQLPHPQTVPNQSLWPSKLILIAVQAAYESLEWFASCLALLKSSSGLKQYQC